MEITSGKIHTAIKTLIYGPEGIGKTTFASQFPQPLFIDTEGSTVHMDVRRLPKPLAWLEILNEVNYVLANPDCCRTLVLDTADWAETLCNEYVCARDEKHGIEDYGYGKGYQYALEEFGRLPNLLQQLIEKDVNVVICCHAQMRKFEQPDELGAYDRWELKLSKKVAQMLKEWADMVLFANYKTIIVNVDNQGAAKGKNKAQGGKRVMYTTHHVCWDAKNRFGLPDETEFSYEVIRPIIEGSRGANAPTPHPAEQAPTHSPQGEGLKKPENPSALTRAVERASKPKPVPTEKPQTSAEAPKIAPALENPYPELPPSLSRQFLEAKVTPDEVRYVIAQRGVYPAHTPWSVICANDQFVRGWLQSPAVWPKVVEMIEKNRTEEEVPF